MLIAVDGLVSIWTSLVPNNQGKSFRLSSAFATFFSRPNDLKWCKNWLVIEATEIILMKNKMIFDRMELRSFLSIRDFLVRRQ